MWGPSQAASLPPGVLVLSVKVRQLLSAQDVQNTGVAPSAKARTSRTASSSTFLPVYITDVAHDLFVCLAVVSGHLQHCMHHSLQIW